MADIDPRLQIYSELCQNYRAIDDLRTKPLGLLPVATGAGALVLAKEHWDDLPGYIPAVGAFGILATLGLFSYELHGIKKCGWLIRAGKEIEESFDVAGPFVSRPHEISGFIDEPFAASVIYPASLGAWTGVALALAGAWVAGTAAIAAYVVTSVLSLLLVRRMERDLDRLAPEYDAERAMMLPKRRAASAKADAERRDLITRFRTRYPRP
jgi:hypothetical protein